MDHDITRMLAMLDGGDPQAVEQLLPLVYDELRRLAAHKLSQERAGQTLDATALVHEAYLRLVGSGPSQPWAGRRHFFAAAAEAMRRILIENARRKRSLKQGGHLQRVELAEHHFAADAPNENLIALDEALTALAATDPDKAELVKLRYFAGLSLEQVAELLGISRATAARRWAFARAWLYDRIAGETD